jgi:hypothetical protein
MRRFARSSCGPDADHRCLREPIDEGGRCVSDETEREQEEHDASDVEEMRSQVAWLEARGWSLGEDALWRHPDKAADVGMTHSQAFTVEARSVDASASQVLDAGPGAGAPDPDEPDPPADP